MFVRRVLVSALAASSLLLQEASASTDATCYDTEGTALDSAGNDCDLYDDYPSLCASSPRDDGDFTATVMCCSCGGGGLITTETSSTVTATTTSVTTSTSTTTWTETTTTESTTTTTSTVSVTTTSLTSTTSSMTTTTTSTSTATSTTTSTSTATSTTTSTSSITSTTTSTSTETSTTSTATSTTTSTSTATSTTTSSTTVTSTTTSTSTATTTTTSTSTSTATTTTTSTTTITTSSVHSQLRAEVEVTVGESDEFDAYLAGGAGSEGWTQMESTFNSVSGTSGWTLENVTKLSRRRLRDDSTRRLQESSSYGLTFSKDYVVIDYKESLAALPEILDGVAKLFMHEINYGVTDGSWWISSYSYVAVEDTSTGEFEAISSKPDWASIGVASTTTIWQYDAAPKRGGASVVFALLVCAMGALAGHAARH